MNGYLVVVIVIIVLGLPIAGAKMLARHGFEMSAGVWRIAWIKVRVRPENDPTTHEAELETKPVKAQGRRASERAEACSEPRAHRPQGEQTRRRTR